MCLRTGLAKAPPARRTESIVEGRIFGMGFRVVRMLMRMVYLGITDLQRGQLSV